jgi:hypothetical protein
MRGRGLIICGVTAVALAGCSGEPPERDRAEAAAKNTTRATLERNGVRASVRGAHCAGTTFNGESWHCMVELSRGRPVPCQVILTAADGPIEGANCGPYDPR